MLYFQNLNFSFHLRHFIILLHTLFVYLEIIAVFFSCAWLVENCIDLREQPFLKVTAVGQIK